MVLTSRPIAKSAAAAMAAANAPQRSVAVKPSAKPPQVLQSGHAPAQLSFNFYRS